MKMIAGRLTVAGFGRLVTAWQDLNAKAATSMYVLLCPVGSGVCSGVCSGGIFA